METHPFSLHERFIKRTLDIIGGSIGSLIFLVLLILLAPFYLFAPKCERGPILYTQKRFKKDGKEFQILKFRTMIVHDKSYWIATSKLIEIMETNSKTIHVLLKLENSLDALLSMKSLNLLMSLLEI